MNVHSIIFGCASVLWFYKFFYQEIPLYITHYWFSKKILFSNANIEVSLREMSCCAGWHLRAFLPWSPQGGCQWPSALPQAVTGLVGFLTGTGHGGQGLLDLRQIGTYKTKNNGNTCTGLCQIRCPTIFKYASTNKPAIVTCVKYKFLT